VPCHRLLFRVGAWYGWADWDSEGWKYGTARWSQPLPCFLGDTLLVRGVLLIGG